MEVTVSPPDEHPSFAPESSATTGRKKPSAGSHEQTVAPLLSISIDPRAGRVVSIESMDPSGDRRELTDEERTRLSELKPEATLRDIVERAFEAGVACVLGQQARGEETPESEEDAELSRMLLRSLIAESAAKRLTQFDVLSPAIVGTLIERAASRDRTSDAGADH
jgi:hypothetical protein